MCGRYTLYSKGEDIAAHFGLLNVPELSPRFNIPPGGPILAVRSLLGQREATFLHWGLTPAWVKADAHGQPERRYSLINARAETAAEKPAYRAAWRQRRCLVPASGFYEWQNHNGHKRPYYILHAEQPLMAIAGLWESWIGPTGESLESCALITTAAHPDFAGIHTRMPLIVDPGNYDAWLVGNHTDTDWQTPFDASQLRWYPVSTTVSSPQNDDARLIEPEPEI